MVTRREFGIGVAVVAGDGLVRPVNAPSGPPLVPGTQPGVNQAIVLANKVIVSGPGGGVFIYSGTPALGNPPIAWMGSGLVDPFGNVLPSTTGVAGTGTFQAGNVVTAPSGTVGYTATPAANNMLFSFAPAAFTDSPGNAVLAGVTTYGKAGAVYYALNQLPGNDHAGTFGAVTTVYTAASQAGPWTAGSQVNLSASNQESLLADLIQVLGVSTAPGIQLHAGTGLLSAAARLTANGQGVLTLQDQAGLSGTVPAVQVDISTNTAGNDGSAHDITKSWSIPANDGTAGTTYTIKALVLANTGQTTIETLTLGADIAGTTTALATLGVAFNGGALNTLYAIPVELVMIVDGVSAGTPEVYLNGPLGDTAANRLSTNSANMSGFSHTAAFAAGTGGTYAVFAQWGGAGGSAQNAHTIASRLYREGP